MPHARSVILLVALASSSAAAEPNSLFEQRIAAILSTRCLECHSAQKASGGLVLESATTLAEGGDSGAVLNGDAPLQSLLWQRVRDGEMPPEQQGRPQKLADAELEALRQWLQQGAPWPDNRRLDLYEQTTDVRAGRDWWSLQPLERPDVPRANATSPTTPAANPIDAFIRKRLAREPLTPAPASDRRTLLRRLHFDLIGLPPTQAEIASFLADASPDAYERRVDDLLASPHFGERWARYWLDLVRFAETCGYERDQVKPHAWKYRDWVVQAINEDMPYDRFVTEQLAGDELDDRDESTVIATGFLRLGTWNDEPNDPHEYKYERLEDMVHATASAFLGLTVKCARCHDHKFDPIPQFDYYRFAAAFWAGPIEPAARELLGGPSAERLGYEVLGWTDRGRDVPPLHLLKNGDPHRPGRVVEPGNLSLVTSFWHEFESPPASASTTRRRLQLAEWITDARNPLTARVSVNRLWQHHFGEALVRSPNNFGFKGERPTHPELLDWLASEFIAGGWKAKPIHKLIVMSETYRQASIHPQEAAYRQRDSGNRLWWRANRRRLDAEALRDAMLSVSGQLDLRLGGPSFRPSITPDALEGLSRKAQAWQPSPAEEQNRRSLYIFTQRSLLPPLMTTFDFCDTTLPCGQRDVTVVAPQALALLNNEFVHRCSRAFAQRVAAQAEDPRERVALAWNEAFGRDPSQTEMHAALQHLETQRRHFAESAEGTSSELLALSSLCHVLLNANEFVYVD